MKTKFELRSQLVVLFSALVVLPFTATGCKRAEAPGPKNAGADSVAELGEATGEAAALESSEPATAATENVATSETNTTPNEGLLVSVAQLQEKISDPNLRILDVRPQAAFDAGHIPGARRVEMEDWRAVALHPGGLQDVAEWKERVGVLGVDLNSRVVVYSDQLPNAARVWWTLEYLGVEDSALLDGGWKAWQDAGAPTSTEPPKIVDTDFTPKFEPERLALIGDLKESIKDESVTIIDSRSSEEFTAAGGHLPRAVHIEWKEVVDDSGRFKPPAELRALFESKNIASTKPAVTYCRSGGRSSVEAFALELAGYDKVKNYYCSFDEWSADAEAPVEKPAETKKDAP